MIKINDIEITENLVEVLKLLGLDEKHNPVNKTTVTHIDTLMQLNDFLIDFMTNYMEYNETEMKKLGDLLISTKAIRDDLGRLDKEFNVILKFE